MANGDKNIMSLNRMKPLRSAPVQEIRDQLKRVINSPDFLATEIQRKFLRFIVSETLAGKSRDIKGFTIATQVLGRGEDFDQAIDPIVSMHAIKLRQALQRYYLTDGKHDPILIDIPKGTYVPTITKRPLTALRRTPASTAPTGCFDSSRPSVLVRPFENISGDKDRDFIGRGLAAELAAELIGYPEIQVLQYGPKGSGKRASDKHARFVIDGDFLGDGKKLKVIVRLTDTGTHELIWSDTITSSDNIGQLISFQKMAASIVAVKLAGEQGIIPRKLSVESSRNYPATLTTYEAVLRFYEFDRTLSPDSFLKAYEALEKAKVSDPDCGPVWTCLARLYATILGLEIPGFDWQDAERKAVLYAEKGTHLARDNQRAWGVLAYVRMLTDETIAAQKTIRFAYELNPDSLINLDGIGYVMTLLGEWERGPELITRAMKYNPGYRHVVHFALWVHALHRGDIEEAYQETMSLRIPALFWCPLAKSATLGLLGRRKEAKRCAADLLELKPDFPDRGLRLISRYIKQQEIVQQVIKGLKAAGVAVE